VIATQLVKAQAAFARLKQDTKCQDMWLAGLIEVQTDQCGVLKGSTWKQLWITEHACQMAHAVQVALVDTYRPGGLSMVIRPDPYSGNSQSYFVKGELSGQS